MNERCGCSVGCVGSERMRRVVKLVHTRDVLTCPFLAASDGLGSECDSGENVHALFA